MFKHIILLSAAIISIILGSGEMVSRVEPLNLVPPSSIELACQYEPGTEVTCDN